MHTLYDMFAPAIGLVLGLILADMVIRRRARGRGL